MMGILASSVTPIVLTYNEESNLQATLERLRWAPRVVVLDSFSTDSTLEIAKGFPNVEVVQRKFDCHSNQANFGLKQARTGWVLSLDADYLVPLNFEQELADLDEATGYSATFRYCVYGRPLRATLYPSRTLLYRRQSAHYVQDGHTQRVIIDGSVASSGIIIDHDDHKPLSHWFNAQIKYAFLEADKLKSKCNLSWKDHLRSKILFAPFLNLFYCLLAKRLILDGWAGIFYSTQRFFAELILSLVLLDRKLRQWTGQDE